MRLEKFILNLPQIEIVLKAAIRGCKELLDSEIRIVGLREKIEKRLKTLQKMKDVLNNHKE